MLMLSGAVTAAAQYNPELGEVGDNRLDETGAVDDSVLEGGDGEDDGAEGQGDEIEGDLAPGGGIDYGGSVRLGLETVVLSFVSASAEGDAVETDATNLQLGIVPSDLGLNVGYAFLDQLVAGARVSLSTFSASTTRGPTESDSSGLSLSLLPYCEYVFTPGETLEWLAYGTLGIQVSSDSTPLGDISRFDFLLGAGGGAHIVLSEHVSIDPVAELGYAIGSLSEDDDDFDLSTLVVAVRAGISVWL